MKKLFFISVLLFPGTLISSQSFIKVVAPEKTVAVGEPFRLQFVVEQTVNSFRFIPPGFKGLRLVRGPEKYEGSQFINNRRVQLTNYIYTLVAERPGSYTINGAKIKLDNNEITGDAVTIIVEKAQLSASERDDYSGYVLLPGENALKKIQENLFVKLFVDRRSCFVGEPIVATFKLFSRLQSKSDIIKNPGFYGFSVHDMLNLEDRVKETERINGKEFDVHTIRKVQLYPLQPGRYTIDEMKIENRVEFSQSVVNKKTEQQITEGVLNQEEEAAAPGTAIYETSLATEPVIIDVKPLPVKNKPSDFSGAAGDFTIRAVLDKNVLDKNEQGFMTVTIEGKGNFMQITAPVIQWPKELEGFEPAVKDFLDKRTVPLTGGRIFRYPFISSATGKWTIPAISFSYFNSNSNSYKTISADSLIISISAQEFKRAEIKDLKTTGKKVSIEEANKKANRIAFTLMALAVTGALGYWLLKGRQKNKPVSEEPVIFQLPSVAGFFESIDTRDSIAAREFYNSLQNAAWSYLSAVFHLSGTEMNKNFLAAKLRLAVNDEAVIYELIDLLGFFETAIFTGIEPDVNRSELSEKIQSVLNRLKTGYSENL